MDGHPIAEMCRVESTFDLVLFGVFESLLAASAAVLRGDGSAACDARGPTGRAALQCLDVSVNNEAVDPSYPICRVVDDDHRQVLGATPYEHGGGLVRHQG